MVKIRLSGLHGGNNNDWAGSPADSPGPGSGPSPSRSLPKIKLKTAATTPAPASNSAVNGTSSNRPQGVVPRIRVKTRKIGDGYDSEAPDREEDPLVEESIILRMLPGEHLQYLQKAVESGDLGHVSIRFKDPRRAVVNIAGQLFAAKLVDLPTITETFKTFDKKNIYKATDVCQMLLITGPISHEDDVFEAIPDSALGLTSSNGQVKSANSSQKVSQVGAVQWPHGITPPLFNSRKQRFRKRVSNNIIETVEARVDELFRLDDEAEESKYELVMEEELADAELLGLRDEEEEEEYEKEEEEYDETYDMTPAVVDDLFDVNAELARVLGSDSDTSGDNDDDDDEDYDRDNEMEGMDEDEREAFQHNQILHDEIKDLENTMAAKQRDADNTVNQIMKDRLLDVVKKLKQELDMKRKQLPVSSTEAVTSSVATSEQEATSNASKPVGATLDINGDDVDIEDEDDEEDEDDGVEGLF